MLTAILSPLSKAAGTSAITSPPLRLHPSWGAPGDGTEVVESQGQCDGGGDRQGDWGTDQGAPEKQVSQEGGSTGGPEQTTSRNQLRFDFQLLAWALEGREHVLIWVPSKADLESTGPKDVLSPKAKEMWLGFQAIRMPEGASCWGLSGPCPAGQPDAPGVAEVALGSVGCSW